MCLLWVSMLIQLKIETILHALLLESIGPFWIIQFLTKILVFLLKQKMMVTQAWLLTVIPVHIQQTKINRHGVSYIGIHFIWLLSIQCLFRKTFILQFIKWLMSLVSASFFISSSKQEPWKPQHEDLILLGHTLMHKLKDNMDAQILQECFCKEEEAQVLHYLIGQGKLQWINLWQLEYHQIILQYHT